MPRVIRGREKGISPRFTPLVGELAEELRHSQEVGQPLIEEHHYPKTDAIRVTVIWDKWGPIPDEERSAIIQQAYEEAEGPETRNRIALAIGLTVPEAAEAGLLPFQIVPGLRSGDPVSADQCRQALIQQGASILADPNRPQLRFATKDEADKGVRRLLQSLPSSEAVWIIQESPQPLL